MRHLFFLRFALLVFGAAFLAMWVCGQNTQSGQAAAQAGTSTEDFQKATQNPVSSLISVPIQDNSNFGIGPFDRTQNVLNIQPVIPIRASENWNLIIRWITPVIWQPAPGTANLEVFSIEENTPAFLAAQNVFVLETGYCNITMLNAPPANRIEMVLTLHFPLKTWILVSDRNREDLNWKSGQCTWRYRNRFTLFAP